jgi:hypothetical protein
MAHLVKQKAPCVNSRAEAERYPTGLSIRKYSMKYLKKLPGLVNILYFFLDPAKYSMKLYIKKLFLFLLSFFVGEQYTHGPFNFSYVFPDFHHVIL